VVAEGRTIIQGVWLDWAAIRAVLQQEVSELFPQLSMLPVHDEGQGDPARMLASAPITLNVRQPRLAAMQPEAMSPTIIALVVAWSCLAAAAVAAAVLLAGVMALSERRAAFVSAVTHELRTPLTTFRMYAEMLALGMVREESQRRAYLETLRTEADRLFHLVENVLSYARLERGAAAAPRTETTVDELLATCTARLAGRAAEAGMELRIDLPAEFGPVQLATDRAAVEQILFNLVDNACKYAQAAKDRRIQLKATATRTQLLLRVVDHGPGIAPQAAAALFRPFTKSASDAANTAPGVGLGLALCRRLARDLGGDLRLEPCNGDPRGASFVFTLPR
ncbi:MAG: HAMP domain-containing sensor histidine kinase, partial [Pirellulales bacterium]